MESNAQSLMNIQENGFHGENFIRIQSGNGLLADMSDNPHPIRLYGWEHPASPLSIEEEGTTLGFVVKGTTNITTYHADTPQSFNLIEGMYFSVPGAVSVTGGHGILISSLHYHGQFMLGGPIEKRGRLSYIDGCSDSLIVPPTVKGNPCLNHLHLPPGTRQTRHTHPSVRVGVIMNGEGYCIVPEHKDGTGSDLKIPLTPGQIFVIPQGRHHSFFTDNRPMDVIAYHPDSDIGPTDEDHPMINRTDLVRAHSISVNESISIN